ncbi:glycosyltransferase family 2 protein [Noviherbaspirillum humi]|nr:glycosyltransferase family 2 protein [Noviherbaspirillum humi]
MDRIQDDIVQEDRIAVVIPSYRVTRHIANVVARMPALVWRIYIVDDACPDASGKFAEETLHDPRIRVLYHAENQGVGGAVMTGYRAAIEDGAEVIVKIDGDDQMDPGLIQQFIDPILAGEADYTKGNRFFDLEEIRAMPGIRLFGNAVLSFMAKFSTGYWDLFDPTNGYTAIHADIARHLPFDRISKRYFFETDILFRLNTLRAVVVDVPMDAKYGDEVSNLKISKVAGEFLVKHIRNFGKRIFYNYYLRDMSVASVELPIGLFLFVFGVVFGGYHWIKSAEAGIATPAGTVMLAALPILVGLQMILAFVGHDVMSVPRRPRHGRRSAPRHAASTGIRSKP